MGVCRLNLRKIRDFCAYVFLGGLIRTVKTTPIAKLTPAIMKAISWFPASLKMPPKDGPNRAPIPNAKNT